MMRATQARRNTHAKLSHLVTNHYALSEPAALSPCIKVRILIPCAVGHGEPVVDMKSAFPLFAMLMVAGAASAADSAKGPPPGSLDLAAEHGGERDEVLDRLFRNDTPATSGSLGGGLIGSTLGVVDGLLAKLGIDPDELADALSQAELSEPAENWREESSGEVGVSFGLAEGLSVGPSFGLTYEEENLAGQREPWSQQLKLGARYNF
jgi:hypothetical protein